MRIPDADPGDQNHADSWRGSTTLLKSEESFECFSQRQFSGYGSDRMQYFVDIRIPDPDPTNIFLFKKFIWFVQF